MLFSTEFFIADSEMDTEAINLEVSYKPSDWRPYLLKARKGSLLVTTLFIFISIFIVYIAASHFIAEQLSTEARVSAIAFLLTVPALALAINLIAIERLARAISSRKSVALSVTEAGIASAGEFRTAAFEWKAYKRAVEHKDRFVLISDHGGLLIPKRCFKSNAQVAAFRDLIRKSLEGPFHEQWHHNS